MELSQLGIAFLVIIYQPAGTNDLTLIFQREGLFI